MKLGLLLHADRGVDAVMAEAKRADAQGFDSVWLFDHLMAVAGENTPDGPIDSFTLMTAIAAVTTRVRLAWAMLNTGFRNPAVLAKMLASLDVISKGRVIASLGSGWFKDEYAAYNVPLIDDHDERAVHGREVAHLIKELWSHPAPERVTFEGRYVRVHNLPFNPAPAQKPHPPIWIGGDSEATLQTVKEVGDGWVMLRSGDPDTVAKVLSAPDWPKREMTLVKGVRMVVAETHDAAITAAREEYQALLGSPGLASTFEAFLAVEVVGSADECLSRLAEIESWGINYLRLNFRTSAAQDKAATLILPRLHELGSSA